MALNKYAKRTFTDVVAQDVYTQENLVTIFIPKNSSKLLPE